MTMDRRKFIAAASGAAAISLIAGPVMAAASPRWPDWIINGNSQGPLGWPSFDGCGTLEARQCPETKNRFVCHHYIRDGFGWGMGFATMRRFMEENADWHEQEAKHVQALRIAILQGIDAWRRNEEWLVCEPYAHKMLPVAPDPTDWWDTLIPHKPDPIA